MLEPDQSRPPTSVVVPAYGRWDLVSRLLTGLHVQDAEFDIVVVDDASPTPPPAQLVDDPKIRVVRNPQNRGFAGAVNEGVSHSTGGVVCVVNSDVVITPHALSELARQAQALDSIVGPRSISPAGVVHAVPRRFHTIARILAEYFVPLRLLPRLDAGLRDVDRHALSVKETIEVEWVVGSCLVFPRSVWERIGPMDERFHMQSEEMDWQLKAKTAGVSVYYVPSVAIVHDDGGSSPDPARRFLAIWRAHVLFVEKHHGKRGLARLQVGMAVLYALMAPGWRLAEFLPRLRDKVRTQRARHRAALALALRPSRFTKP